MRDEEKKRRVLSAANLVLLLLLALLLLAVLSSVLGNSGVGVVVTRDNHGVTLGDVSSTDLIVVVHGGVVVGGASALSVLPHGDGAVVRGSNEGGVDSGQVVALGVLVGLDVDGLDSGTVALLGHVKQVHLGRVLVVDLVANVSLKEGGSLDEVDASEDDNDAELHGDGGGVHRVRTDQRDQHSIYTLPV